MLYIYTVYHVSKELYISVFFYSDKFIFLLLFIYNQIPPQSEENNILHKRTEIKY